MSSELVGKTAGRDVVITVPVAAIRPGDVLLHEGGEWPVDSIRRYDDTYFEVTIETDTDWFGIGLRADATAVVHRPELSRQLDIHFIQPNGSGLAEAPSRSVTDPTVPRHMVRVCAAGETWVDGIRGHDREDAIRNALWNWGTGSKYPADWFEYLGLDDNQE